MRAALPAALVLLLAPPLAGQTPADPCAQPEARAFDFMVGQWRGEERAVAAADTTVVSTSEVGVHPVLGGCALEETWAIEVEGRRLFDAHLLRAYDAESGRWMLAYADTGGRFQLYEGRAEDGGWSFFRERESPEGPVLVRIRWTPSTDGFEQAIARSSDGGATWESGSLVRYRPDPASAVE